jgi:hypothetical protein
MKKEDLLRHVGSMQQVASVRRVAYGEGRARDLGAIEVVNGPMRFTTMADKCLDISELSYKGTQLSFLSKPGLNGRNPFDTHGEEALRSIMGGLFFTCGLENICAPFTDDDGREYPMHGRMRTTPAEHICADAQWQGDDYVMRISGEMREAELFGENLVLRRRITTRYGSAHIQVDDEVTNEGFRPEPAMLMYHCNFGYPFLRKGVRLILPTGAVTPRDALSQPHVGNYAVMEAPRDNEPEYVFIHDMRADGDGNSFAAIVDDDRGLAVQLLFNINQLPHFMQWKSIASGDYVSGLEPSNSSVYGRRYHQKRGDLNMLLPQQSMKASIAFRILEGEDAIGQLEKLRERLINIQQ